MHQTTARRPARSTVCRLVVFLLVLLPLMPNPALAGGRRARRAYVVVPSSANTASTPVTTVRVQPTTSGLEVNNYGRLGSYYPTPYMMVRGNAPVGGGYSPLGMYGENTMALYGPLSPFRFTSAPVLTYTRGYDGRTVASPGTSMSTPNLPSLTPVVYPTQANNYYGFRQSGSPPWWANGMDWIDQN